MFLGPVFGPLFCTFLTFLKKVDFGLCCTFLVISDFLSFRWHVRSRSCVELLLYVSCSFAPPACGMLSSIIARSAYYVGDGSKIGCLFVWFVWFVWCLSVCPCFFEKIYTEQRQGDHAFPARCFDRKNRKSVFSLFLDQFDQKF